MREGRKYVYLDEQEFKDLLYRAGARTHILIANTRRGTHTGYIYDNATGKRLGPYSRDTRGTYRILKTTYRKLADKTVPIGQMISLVLGETQ